MNECNQNNTSSEIASKNDRCESLDNDPSSKNNHTLNNPPAEHLDLESFLPGRTRVEPRELTEKSGIWECDPALFNVLSINGRDIPYKSHVLYTMLEISWSPATGEAPYSNPNPRTDFGGAFKRLKFHSLVFALGDRGVGGHKSFGIEGSPGQQVWIAVNDTNYSDNSGKMVIKM